MTDAELTLLVRKYSDPEKEGLVNYLNLNNDLVALPEPSPAGISQEEAASLAQRVGYRVTAGRPISVDEQKDIYDHLVFSGLILTDCTCIM